MFKTITIAALGFAAVSAQFLDVRNLQNSTTTATTVTVASLSAACTVGATGAETNCGIAGYCCVATTRTGTLTTPINLCVSQDFLGQNLTIAGTTHAFAGRCLSSTVTVVNRTTCAADDVCSTNQCCSNVTLTAGPAAAGTATRRFCTDGSAALLANATYAGTSWVAGYTANVRQAACTPKAAPAETSFSSYIKASVMMVVAVLSVALF